MENEPFIPLNSNILTIDPFNKFDDKLIVGFSTRNNGYSIKPYESLNLGLHVQDDEQKVILNREKVAEDLKISLKKWVFAEQVHSNKIKKISQKDCGSGTLNIASVIKGADGLYTKEANVLLASLYADCVPLYFYSPSNALIGLAHAGWKGTVGKIGTNMVHMWTEVEKVSLDSIYVAIGPSISQESYEVDDYVIDKVNKVIVDEYQLPYIKVNTNQYLLDLKLLNKQLLLATGIKEEQIFVSNYCTYKNSKTFFSYRRHQQTGRMMSFIGRK
ncbi:peptidoglycan editing factor PgeF [Anaerobacillus alkalidiazotrophicus]|uniref:peptidoglycan editing factor PgeF n=1 Tax=Anaerobacillus alkalidiazotrophicus TaxID=472963 RepID=UPI000A012156|nr:peptidoglycan editing factor PgeF [Anaerobacillus alkalidiazotrophicus]